VGHVKTAISSAALDAATRQTESNDMPRRRPLRRSATRGGRARSVPVAGLLLLALPLILTVAFVTPAGPSLTMAAPPTASPTPAEFDDDGETIASERFVRGRDFVPSELRLADCAIDDFECRSQAYGNIAFYEGAATAIDTLEREIAEIGDTSESCHLFTHTIGAATLERMGNGAEAIVEAASTDGRGPELCTGGFFHGISDKIGWGQDGKIEDAAVEFATLCDADAVWETTIGGDSCIHGAGHVFMQASNYDLPRSLIACDAFSGMTRHSDFIEGPGYGERMACLTGVYMENGIVGLQSGSTYMDRTRPTFPCDTYVYDAAQADACWGILPSVLQEEELLEVSKIDEFCQQATFNSFGSCIIGWSNLIIHNNVPFGETERGIRQCIDWAATNEIAQRCLHQGASETLHYWDYPAIAERYCLASDRPEDCWPAAVGGLLARTNGDGCRKVVAAVRELYEACPD
jgi:hypothetical protein